MSLVSRLTLQLDFNRGEIAMSLPARCLICSAPSVGLDADGDPTCGNSPPCEPAISKSSPVPQELNLHGKRHGGWHAHVGVATLVRREGDGALLMGLRCGAHGTGTWAVPGGHLEFQDMSILEGALRELYEETELYVRVGHAKLTNHVTYTHFPENHRAYVTVYAAATVSANAEAKLLEPDRCAGWRWILPGAPAPGPLFRPFENLISLGVNPWTV